MVGEITTVPEAGLGVWSGRLSDEDVPRLDRATPVFLGLAASSRTRNKREE